VTAPPRTLPAALERAARHRGSGIRLVDHREQERFLPWDEIAAGARRTAAGLRALGIEPGDRVALVFPTGADFFSAFFGAQTAGAVPVPLYPPLRLGRAGNYAARTAVLVAGAGARLVLAQDRLTGLLAGGPVALAAPRGVWGLAGLPAAGEAPPPPVEEDALALVQLSSGTTAHPRPVALTHRALLAQADLLNGLFPHRDPPPSLLSWLPLYHDMGLIGCVLPAMTRPGVLTLLAPETFAARPALWLRALSRYRASISAAPNFAYAACIERVRDEDLNGLDLEAWTTAFNGAEAVSPVVLRAFARRFSRWGFRAAALTPVYGLAEAALAVTCSALEEPFTTTRFDRAELVRDHARPAADGWELVSAGKPLPGFEVRVVASGADPRVGGDLGAERVGRLWVRGPSLMDGYLGDPVATARTLVGGWLDTGDLGFFHGGQLFLTGRAKDLVVIRGRSYSPDEFEQALAAAPGRAAAGAAAVSMLAEGAVREELVLLVERPRGARPEEDGALTANCRREVLAATGVPPDRIVLLPAGALPRTSSGKIRRRETLRRYQAGELGAAAVPAPVAEVAGDAP
jgi:acyl-CoA synthetase (AMP-forming)/AMP-acid ligase II